MYIKDTPGSRDTQDTQGDRYEHEARLYPRVPPPSQTSQCE